jgi:uncharacterized protein YdhG (YjbR/CyaY superfamily)
LLRARGLLGACRLDCSPQAIAALNDDFFSPQLCCSCIFSGAARRNFAINVLVATLLILFDDVGAALNAERGDFELSNYYSSSPVSRDHPMPPSKLVPKDIDEYIARFAPEVRAILEKIRLTIKNAAPGAQETISYAIPTFRLNGTLVYFAAFKKHIGFYPPVRGNAQLVQALSIYAGAKGSLKFPLDQPIPYRLIERIVQLRVRQNSARAVKSA